MSQMNFVKKSRQKFYVTLWTYLGIQFSDFERTFRYPFYDFYFDL